MNWGVAGKMVIAWLVTFPAAGIVGALACALAKTGLWGTVAVAFIACVVAFIIWRISRRNPITSANVNERADVKVNANPNAKTVAAAA